MAKKQETTKKVESIYNVLSAINVNDKVEQKQNMKYLSWAWAWDMVKRNYPSANYVVDLYEGKPYLQDEHLGYMVSTKVTIDSETIPMQLPLMNGANKSLKQEAYSFTTRYGEKTVEAATMFDVNTAIMRCLTKNLAMFGLGHYIYANEDMPLIDEQSAVETTKSTISSTSTKTKPADTKPEKNLIVIQKGDKNYVGLVKYVKANVNLGVDGIVDKVSTKYKMTQSVKTTIKEIVEQAITPLHQQDLDI